MLDILGLVQTEPSSPLDTPVRWTKFLSMKGRRALEQTTTPREMAALFKKATAATKMKLPWVKLSTFGDFRTEGKSLRNNKNMLTVTGIEADYDAGEVKPETAVHLLREHKIAALVYTTPSHTKLQPRWRVLAFCAEEQPPAERKRLLARVQGALGGILAPESFTPSQAYLYGNVDGRSPIETFLVDGRYIDQADDLDAGAIFKRDGDDGSEYDGSPGERLDMPFEKFAEIVMMVPNDGTDERLDNYHAWVKFLAAIHHQSDASEEGRALAHKWSEQWGEYTPERTDHTWDSFHGGSDGHVSTGHHVLAMAARYGYSAGIDREAVLDQLESLPEDPKDAERRLALGDDYDDTTEFTPREWTWVDPKTIPERPWLYGTIYARGYVSAIVSPGGGGKTAYALTQALAIATGRAIFKDEKPREQEPRKVWYINLEDPREEMDRRVAAACLHHDIKIGDLQNRLMIDGSELEIIIAEETRQGFTICLPVVEGLIAAIRKYEIAVLWIDPFVSCHRVTENDNNKIDAVVKMWARIARETNCAICLVHHTRKGGVGQEGFTADDSRGASAQVAACRKVLTLNTMPSKLADKLGLQHHWRYFRVDDAKQNMAPPAEVAQWRKLVSVSLGNIGPLGGDNVQAVEEFELPAREGESPDAEEIAEAMRNIRNGQWRRDPRSPQWVGIPIMAAFGWDPRSSEAKKDASNLIKQLLEDRQLKIEVREDAQRRPRECVVVSDDRASEHFDDLDDPVG